MSAEGSSTVADAALATPARPARTAGLQRAVRWALWLFLLACIFDPADRLLGFKVDLFLLAWGLTAAHFLWQGRLPRVHRGLLLYIAAFLCVPVLSIAWYFATDGSEPFEGVPLLKGYLLMTLAALLFIERINLLPQLAAILTVLAIAIIVVFAMVVVMPDLFSAFRLISLGTGMVVFDQRDYGGGLVLTQIYFVTSPMLAISIAYYFDRWRASKRPGHLALVGLSAAGMMLAGTRNNLAVAVLLPLALAFLTARDKLFTRVLAIVAVGFLVLFFIEDLAVLLDPNEFSNSLKLALLNDYGALLSDPTTLFFGQGLGAYHTWEARGAVPFYVSELTYVELVRSFGIVGALVIVLLLVFPIVHVFSVDRSSRDKNVIVGYAFYLVMCATNPNLFSSMGMLILAIVLANIFIADAARRPDAFQAGA